MDGLTVKIFLFLATAYSSWLIFSFVNLTNKANSDNEIMEEDEEPDDVVFGTLHTLQNLSMWATLEENISQELTQRLRLLEIEATLIKQYLQSYADSTKQAMKHVHTPKPTPRERGEVVGSSGVLGHQMVTRYTSVISRLREFRRSSDYVNIQERVHGTLQLNRYNRKNISRSSNDNVKNTTDEMIAQPNSSLIWPGWEDKYMSTLAFIHIQNEYEYKPKDLRVGLTFDTSFERSLTARQCAEIGMFALSRDYIHTAIEWLKLAKQVVTEDNDQTISIEIVSSMLKLAIQQNNRFLKYSKMRLDYEDPDDYYIELEQYFTEPILNGMDGINRTTGRSINRMIGKTQENSTFLELALYVDLCQGRTLQPIEVQSKLKCYYEKQRHPYLYINPLKVEQLSDSPPILQFYEMLGPNETARLKSIGRANMSLSMLQEAEGIEEDTKYRTSVGTGIGDDHILKILKFAEIVSGLALMEDASEATQMAEYTYGRFYTYHSDLFFNETIQTVVKKGNRVATILYYLELPPEGGLTPFCQAGVSGHQVRGSAIFWYNLYRNGTMRQDVTHGACPVIHGHKIIMTHWIRYLGNFHNYKCSLNPEE